MCRLYVTGGLRCGLTATAVYDAEVLAGVSLNVEVNFYFS